MFSVVQLRIIIVSPVHQLSDLSHCALSIVQPYFKINNLAKCLAVSVCEHVWVVVCVCVCVCVCLFESAAWNVKRTALSLMPMVANHFGSSKFN